MDDFDLRLNNALTLIRDADYILIGAGAGFSTAAGIEYFGRRFTDNFGDFIEKYNLTDMYSAGFYPYKTQEEKWAYWVRHVYLNRYQVGKTKLYSQLLEIVKDKDYFVLTTNVDHQFWINGFEDERIFATQGDYGLMQCINACHNKLYDNEDFIKEALEKTVDCKIPSDLVPKCQVCGADMDLNLRKDNFFVEDEKWMEMNNNYINFLRKSDGSEIVFLELGVGFNTPTIIRFPFERMTLQNKYAKLIRLNKDYPEAMPKNQNKTISFNENISEIFEYWLK